MYSSTFRFRPHWVVLGLALSLHLFSSSLSAEEERLTLRSVILKALGSNNDIRVDALGILAEQEKIKVASQALDPRLEGSIIYQSIRTPQNTQSYTATGGGLGFGGAPALNQPNIFMQRDLIAKMTLVDRTSYGTSFELGTTMRRLDNSLNRRVPPGIFSPEYETFTGLTVTQPLLRGFGRDANLAEIRIAQANSKIAEYEWKARTAMVVAEVMKRYFDVIFTHENIRIQREGTSLAEKLLGDTRKRSKEGVAANNDVVVAEAGVYQRKEEVIAAEMQYIERQNALQLLFKTSQDVMAGSSRIVPTDELSSEMPPTSRATLMGLAMANRYEIKQAEQFINARYAQSQLASSQSKSRLDFVASGGLHGLQGSTQDSYSRAFQAQGPEWTTGFQYSIPLNQDHMKATERLALRQQDQAVVQAEKIRLQVLLEVDTIHNRVLLDQQRLEATRRSREAARQSAEAELKRLFQGVSTSFQVLQLQRDYSQARSRELAALADFNKALADLYLATATLLQKQQISVIEDSPQPAQVVPVYTAAPKPKPTVAADSKPAKPSFGQRIGNLFRGGKKSAD
jgi:outer membrane protein TolC